jgi:hypothetical protein
MYLLDINKNILAQRKMVNGKVYFELKNPYYLPKDVNTTFYVVVEFNDINSVNQTNKRIKLKLLKNDGTFRTLVVSTDNGSETNYWVSSSFNANTYFIRKAKPIFSSVYTRTSLKL